MKTLLLIAAGAGLALTLAACGGKSKTELKNDTDSVSYSIGIDVGTTFARQGIEVEPEAFLQGLKDASDTAATPLLTQDQMRTVMMAYQQKMMAKAQEKMQERSAKSKGEGERFLAENKSKPGVITTASGLQYIILHSGTGRKPKASDRVTVHYRGTLLSGEEFDNSYSRGEPVTFAVNEVIPGWAELFPLLPVGTKCKVFIPPHLAYGDQAAGPIPPGSTLVFDVEFLGIK